MNISTFNYIEASVWFAIAVVMALMCTRGGSDNLYGRLQGIASVTFFVFGISDVIEASTGAWWQPFWLLLIKTACICSFIWLFVSYTGIKNSG